MKLFYRLIILLVCIGTSVSAASRSDTSPFDVSWDTMPLTLKAGERFELNAFIRVPPGHYLYVDETALEFLTLEGVRIDDIVMPASTSKEDPFFHASMDVFEKDVIIHITGHVPAGILPGERELAARLSFRGCTPKLCLRPEEHEILFRISVEPGEGSAPALSIASPDAPQASIGQLLRENDFSRVMNAGFGWMLVIVFIAGVLTSLTPCVWPVIPVVLLVVGVESEARLRKNFLLSSTLVGGMILVYALLGLLAAWLGKGLGFLFQQQFFLWVVVILFLVMGSAMLGIFHFRLPHAWTARLSTLGGKGYRGAFLAGLGVGLIASPCVGPVVGALLAYVAYQQSFGLGFLLLCVYGCGLGLLFVLLGTGYGTFSSRFRGGAWLTWVKRFIGVVLIGSAFFYSQSLIDWQFPKTFEEEGQVAWVTEETEAFSRAQESGKPILIDFYADWCPPCRQLDRTFFRRASIAKLAEGLVMFRVDATVETPAVTKLIERYGVRGWPSLLFLSPLGDVYRDLSVTSYDPETLESNMREALMRASSLDTGL